VNIDELREGDPARELGRCTDNDYALIFDSQGKAWRTETLPTGEQVKFPAECPWLP
jgi:hypothetical protein